MYQQGFQDGPNGQDRAWYAAPPRTDSPAPRRRSRSRARQEDAPPASPQASPAMHGQQASAPAQQGHGNYTYANNGISHPADQPGGYASSYNNYTAPNGLNGSQGSYDGYNGYPEQTGYPNQPNYPEQTGYPNQPNYPEQPAYPNQPNYPEQPAYPNQPNYPEQPAYPSQNGYPYPNAYSEPPQSSYPKATKKSSGSQRRQRTTPKPDPAAYQPGGYYPGYEQQPSPQDYRQNAGGGMQGGYAQPAPQPANDHAAYPAAYPDSYGAGYRPPEQPAYRTQASPRQSSGKGNPPSPLRWRNLLITLVTLAVIAAGVILIINANNPDQPVTPGTDPVTSSPETSSPSIIATLKPGTQVNKAQAAAYATKFLPNVYVDGICLADMTFQEGSDAVWKQAQQKQSGWYVRLKNENGSFKDITADMLGISFDPTAALQQAWAVGHTPDENGQVTDKMLMQSVNAALATEYHFTSAQQSANTSPIDTILDTLQTNAYRAPQDAVILSFNPDDFVNPFTFQQEVWGQWLDISAVKQEILNMVSTLESGEVLLQITPIAPNVTVADLQKTVTLRCRAVTPISSSSTEDRTNNIRVAMSKINGKSLAHGDKFSFNKFVGRRSIENGFFQAIEYAYGEEVMGVGGGVCQASTTVYLAAVQSGMTITNREAHSNPVNYTSLGMDATVSDTRGREVDFTFKNESGGRVFIAAHVVESGSNRRSLLCEVRIYGPSLEDVHYKLESETIEVIPKPEEPKLKEDKTGEHVFYVDETKQISKGREGYVVETYLCTYQGDNLISRDKISTDTYPARQDVFWVGTNMR